VSHQITPVTGNDDPRHAPMTSTILSSLQSQRNVSRTQTSRPPRRPGHTTDHGATELGFNSAEPATPLQGSGPGAALPATLLQGSSTSPSSTLAHSYTPKCTAGSPPCTYKRRCLGPSQGRFLKAHLYGSPNINKKHFRANLLSTTLDLSRDLGSIPSLAKLVSPTTSTPMQDNISLILPLLEVGPS
jgi:hypothetical protein